MSRHYLIAVGAALVVLLGINLWLWPNSDLQRSMTSFGVDREGYKAAYDLLSELGLPVSRSYLPVSRVPTNRPLWLVSPYFLDPEQEDADTYLGAQELLKWIGSGGTAVVFGEPGSAWKKLGIVRHTGKAGESPIEGDFAPVPLTITVPGYLVFSNSADGARIRLGSAQAALALELPVGAGRLIAIADGRFLRNVNLTQGDASVLLFDLARALGAPVFDERCHGLTAPLSLTALIAASRAMLPLGLGLLAALLWIGEQRKWPRRVLADAPDGPQPSIASFVESLGVLYSRVNDPQSVFRSYRSGFLRRVAKQISPRADLSEDRVVERLARDRSLSSEANRWLVDGMLPKDEKELVIAVRAIESCPRIWR